ncbi:MAG: alpha/beta hydrolase [Myxococcota bacterium]|nr:alpha/beta hydrolase [Myxococcota bacterium]
MKSAHFSLRTPDQIELHGFKWLPEYSDQTTAALLISHGMAEHAGRYGDFAAFLTSKGIAVYAYDHRGHGKTAKSLSDVGFFSEANGWELVKEDLRAVSEWIKDAHPNVPFFIFGHSMGSSVLRSFLFQYGRNIDGAILSGMSSDPGMLGHLGILICKVEMKIRGKRGKSELLDKLTFGQFNARFKPNRTGYDWLSRDEQQVDAYIRDPYCGGVFSAGFFYDLFTGVMSINKIKNIKKMPVDLPIYIFSGERDPVGGNAKGVRDVYDKFKKAGIKDVTLKLYPDGRHEMLNETNRQEVYQDVFQWIAAHSSA